MGTQLHTAYIEVLIKTVRWKENGWERIHRADSQPVKAGADILPPDKVDFMTKSKPREKEGLFTVVRGSIHQKNTTIIHVYICINRAQNARSKN